jgi:hypothetical protein
MTLQMSLSKGKTECFFQLWIIQGHFTLKSICNWLKWDKHRMRAPKWLSVSSPVASTGSNALSGYSTWYRISFSAHVTSLQYCFPLLVFRVYVYVYGKLIPFFFCLSSLTTKLLMKSPIDMVRRGSSENETFPMNNELIKRAWFWYMVGLTLLINRQHTATECLANWTKKKLHL